ncbi:MBL fold metallo-hydrolase [Bacillus sp. KH172YL63]|uniref:MBL fold metallo-hydrolase n=1 Tax=Bacillus sp. KH172YL63 TaxID=2709784 RepID=UPI0013E45E9A|nr:MBL fold metallo-hydrolase [Bacillus sp. KH172YL63]BCB05555.1 membrane protein [Bacillus sp. KH172YL63]
MIISLFILLIIVVTGWIVIRPPLGKKASRERVHLSPRQSEGVFQNELPTSMDTSFSGTVSMVRDLIKRDPGRKPPGDLPRVDFPSLRHPHPVPNVTWFGHSASMIELEDKRLLLDPMFGPSPSPLPWLGGKRYSKELPFSMDDLPDIDAVIFSHDHYDHLDYSTIQKLRGKVQQFFVPIGVGSHLEHWGIDRGHITELDWWDELEWSGLTLVCTPARHFSGRSLNDRNASLWCSWCIIGPSTSIFFSGDSGYGPHFEKIGRKYGPFDLTMMECGQYDPRWAPIHMTPEETVQAHRDVQGKWLLPIHWGAFTLSFHAWTDPVERVTKKAEEIGVPVATPRIGETFLLKEGSLPDSKWWR